jgi:uncharacterized iron-regulated membrane protein
MAVETTPAPAQVRTKPQGLFRACWRWHFYASVLVVPVLLLLASTGLIYLFRFQLEPLLHPSLFRATPETVDQITQPYGAQQTAVERAYPGATLVSMAEPRDEGRPTIFSVVLAGGKPTDVCVNPYGAEVHGDLMAGRWGDHVIELGACWAIVMALTGYYLFFKGRRRDRLRRRHGRVGLFVGAGLLLLVATDLPWTGFWGEKVQSFATAKGSSMWSLDPGAISDPTSTLDESLPHSHAHEVPWAQGDSTVPLSQGAGTVADVDTAVAVAAKEGLRHPMTVALPGDDKGVFSVIGYAFDDPTAEKAIHVDQYGGKVVSTYGLDDYPLLAKVVSQGIGLHEGRSFGLLNFWLTATFCLAVIFMCVTGPLMWWRRRPAGTLAALRGRMPVRTTPWLLGMLVVIGAVLPLFGLSLVVVLLLDLVARRVGVAED